MSTIHFLASHIRHATCNMALWHYPSIWASHPVCDIRGKWLPCEWRTEDAADLKSYYIWWPNMHCNLSWQNAWQCQPVVWSVCHFETQIPQQLVYNFNNCFNFCHLGMFRHLANRTTWLGLGTNFIRFTQQNIWLCYIIMVWVRNTPFHNI